MPAIPPKETAAVPPASLSTLRRLVLTIKCPPRTATSLDGFNYCRHRRHQGATGASRSTEFFRANAGQIFASRASERLRIEREEFLGLADAAQREAADRYQACPLGGGQTVSEGRGDQHRAIDRSAHRGDATGLVDRRAHDREVEPVDAADIAVKNLADMQADIDGSDRLFRGLALFVQVAHAAAQDLLGLERALAGLGWIVGAEQRQRAIADQFQHVAAGLVDRRDGRLGVVVEQRNELARWSAVGDGGVAAQV